MDVLKATKQAFKSPTPRFSEAMQIGSPSKAQRHGGSRLTPWILLVKYHV